MAPFRLSAALVLVALSLACDGRRTSKATLDLQPSKRAVGGHLPPAMAVTVRTPSGVQQVASAAFFAALGPDDGVAYVDLEGLHLWRAGDSRLIAKAAPRGMSANAHGVAFSSAAQSGHGSGVGFMTWSGEARTLIAAPEELPGQAGYLKPALSPDGRFVIAFGDLTPRPSVYRVEIATGATRQLLADAPPSASEPVWLGSRLVWSTGEARASLDVERGEVTVQ